jgi:hypothetical protein
VGDLIQDPKEVHPVPGPLADLSDITEITWKNIDQAEELVGIHNGHIISRKKELDVKIEELVAIDSQLRELLGDAHVAQPKNRIKGFN